LPLRIKLKKIGIGSINLLDIKNYQYYLSNIDKRLKRRNF